MATPGINSNATIEASVSRVVELFTDRDFVRQVSEAAGGSLESFQITNTTEGDFQTVTERAVPADRLPDFAQRFVGKTLAMKQTDSWSAPKDDGGRDVHIEVKLAGVPVSVSALQVLTPESGSTTIAINGSVKCGIPFVGEKVARAAAPAVSKALNLQVSLAQTELANGA